MSVENGKLIVDQLQGGVYELIFMCGSEKDLAEYVKESIRWHGMDMGFESEEEMEENLQSWELIQDNISDVWEYIEKDQETLDNTQTA